VKLEKIIVCKCRAQFCYENMQSVLHAFFSSSFFFKKIFFFLDNFPIKKKNSSRTQEMQTVYEVNTV